MACNVVTVADEVAAIECSRRTVKKFMVGVHVLNSGGDGEGGK